MFYNFFRKLIFITYAFVLMLCKCAWGWEYNYKVIQKDAQEIVPHYVFGNAQNTEFPIDPQFVFPVQTPEEALKAALSAMTQNMLPFDTRAAFTHIMKLSPEDQKRVKDLAIYLVNKQKEEAASSGYASLPMSSAEYSALAKVIHESNPTQLLAQQMQRENANAEKKEDEDEDEDEGGDEGVDEGQNSGSKTTEDQVRKTYRDVIQENLKRKQISQKM